MSGGKIKGPRPMARSIFMLPPVFPSDGRYYRKSIEIIDTYKSFDTRKKYR